MKISILGDARGFLKASGDIETAIDGVADSLDELATDAGQSADEAGDKLERKFKDAFDAVKTESREAGRKVGDDIEDGARKAGDGIDNFKDEGKQSIRETAASFGDVTDALDLVQEVAANAFVGFGPAGLAAGAAAAIGIGLIKSGLDAAKEKADDTVEATHTLAAALRETGGAAQTIADSMSDIVDEKEWFEYWQNLPTDRLTAYANAVKLAGVSWDDLRLAANGNEEALRRANDQMELARNTTKDFMDLGAIDASRAAINQQAEAARAAVGWNEAYASSGIEAQKKVEEAQQEAADASQQWADSLSDHLDVASDGLDQFVKDGKLNLDDWAKEVRARTKDVARIEDFKVDVFPKLSPEAQRNFAELPTETQAQIAEAYKEGGKGDRKKIRTTLEAEVKLDSKVVDTNVPPISIPTEVDTASAVAGASGAANAAQAEANRESNRIEFKTRIDRDELQRQVDRAAASIHPPTITIKTRVSKEQP